MAENLIRGQNAEVENRALALLKSILEENSKSIRLEDGVLNITAQNGARYFVDIKSTKVYDDSGKFICLRVLSPRLPVMDQVIAKSLYLLTNPRPSAGTDHDMLFKVVFVGSEPKIEWPWIKSISLATLGDDFSSLIGVDFAVKTIETMRHSMKLQLWYLNSAHRFKSLGTKYIHGAMGGVILWRAREDPGKIIDLQRSINDFYSSSERSMPTIIIGLCENTNGCNGDKGSLETGENIARRDNLPFFRCELSHPSTSEAPLKYLANMILKTYNVCASGLSTTAY